MRLASVLLLVALAAPAAAGTLSGRVVLVEKDGRTPDASDVVVYLEGVQEKAKPVTATVHMKGKQFVPRLTVVPVGSTISFPNQDPIFHNVFSVSGANRFDLDLYKRPKAGTWTFEKPGTVRVYCNIHPQMSAVVLVLDSGRYTRADKDGAFTLDNVPPGRYSLRAWHDRGGEGTTPVEVPSQGAATATVTLDASKHKRVQHKNKFGRDYGASDKY
jgi:plastocyanin